MNIYGFAMLRNGVKYDFPFRESLLSMAPICKKMVLALGNNDDGTERHLDGIPNLEVINTIWDDKRRDGGYLFSEQTNIALNAIRNQATDADTDANKDAWAIYLQSDEILHEEELPKIVEDLKRADAAGCDAMRFRYLHFWQNHNEIAINKKWYPQEIRAVKVKSNVVNTGDAQTFGSWTKIYESDAHIYHYGHVRDQKAYQEKINRQLKFHYTDLQMPKYSRRWKRKDRRTEVLTFLGHHPLLLKDRMNRLGGIFAAQPVPELFIVGNEKDFSPRFIQSINAQKISFHKCLFAIPCKKWKATIVFNPSILDRLFTCSNVPKKMRSKLALPWTNDFRLLMHLSKIGVGTKRL